MILFALRLLMTMLAVTIAAHILPGLQVKNLPDLLFFGLVLGIVNAIIRPILDILTFPITILTLGLFSFIVNAFTFWLASEISYGIHVTSFWGAFFGGMIVWAASVITNQLIWYKQT